MTRPRRRGQLHVVWEQEDGTLHITLDDRPRHVRLPGLLRPPLALSGVCHHLHRTTAAAVTLQPQPQAQSQCLGRISRATVKGREPWPGQLRPQLGTGVRRKNSCALRSGSAWHQARGANVPLRLELMVRWRETLPGLLRTS